MKRKEELVREEKKGRERKEEKGMSERTKHHHLKEKVKVITSPSQSLDQLKKSPFHFFQIPTQILIFDFTIHEWKEKAASYYIISSVSLNPSLTQSSHEFLELLHNGSYVIFVRKS